MSKKIFSLLLVLGALFAGPVNMALADAELPQVPLVTSGLTDDGDQLVFGNNFTLASGEVVSGDLSVFGGSAKLEESSRVKGDVNVFGGNVEVLGSIDGDINVIGGNVNLRSSAKVGGKQNVVAGNISRDRGAVVGSPAPIDAKRAGVSVTLPSELGLFNRFGRWFASVIADDGDPDGLGAFLRRGNWRISSDPLGLKWIGDSISHALFMTVLAIVAMAIFPNQYARMANVAHGQWLVAGSIGALTWVAVPILVVLMAITICLIPLSIVASLVWAAGIVLGWVVGAGIFGAWLLKGFGKNNSIPLVQTAIGAFALALLGALPVFGWLLGLGASSLGLGALLLTRFGTQPYPRYYQLGVGS